MTSKSAPSSTWAEQVIAQTYRSDWGRLLSLLVARTRRLDLAEDALSEAFARASDRWRDTAIPTNPAAWLYTTAWRVIVGRHRAEAVHRRNVPLLAVDEDWVQPRSGREIDDLDDERLAVVLLCCHPALHPDARPALALRLVLGTSTEEIARLFVVPRSTMAARITRAKRKIVTAGIPLSSPVDDELRTRLNDVCRTVYLAFTAGYAPGRGPDLLRTDLAREAIELAAVLHQLVPDARQVQALYGLLLIQHSRRDARVQNGQLVSLTDQNRSLWHPDELRAGVQLVTDVPASAGYAEELRLQGLIAVQHARATTAGDTDWSAISALYSRLERLTESPVVRLNRAVAVAESEGPLAGLAILEALDETMPRNHRLHAVRADLARRAGDTSLARTSYTAALTLCTNEVEQDFLEHQLDALDSHRT